MEYLRIVTFNCRSVKKSTGAVQDLCKNYDVIILQETWLLDASSKAFDKINYWILFDKLMKRDVPHIVVRLLAFWYTNQWLMVQWHDAVLEHYKICNGVTQGGILSPLFFNLYIDELSRNLSNVNVGCCVNSTVINHIMYAVLCCNDTISRTRR